jgi:hypothetical protein
MAVINVEHELDVTAKFDCLMQHSVSGESIYIRTKETLDAIFKEYSINSADKGQIIANVLGGMSSSITSAAMSTALQWASQEREIELTKLKLAKELDLLDEDILTRKAQVKNLGWEGTATQAQTIRMYGVPTLLNDVVVSLSADGKVYSDTRLVEQQRSNLIKELDMIDSRIKESEAGIHRTVADTLVNHGAWTYTIGPNGIATAPVRTSPNGVVPLSDIQRVIAGEQAKGYSYNAWANSVTASAGMLGTAIASDGAIDDISDLVTLFRTSLTKLQSVNAPTIPTA